MSKKEISWIGLIKVLSDERKKQGEPAGVKDVMDEAKSEWVTIKKGNHDKYIKGTPKGTPKGTRKKGKKGKKGKKCKTSKSKQDIHLSAKHVLDNCGLCTDCMKEIKDCIKLHQ
tara:strand:- start:4763 stop:5104 length:342 start_codon:yes stop_codon:yes gene_type:complete